MSHSLLSVARPVAAVTLGCYVLAVTVVLLTADPSLSTDVIDRTERLLDEQGAPAWVTWGERVQLMLNALMFAPITALASIAMPRYPWGNWVAYAFVGSGLVEVVQAFVLAPRSAQYVDVVANTLGGLIGALLVVPLTGWMRRVTAE